MKLVVYFSASGTTKNVASEIAKGIGADLFEIEPKSAYTRADLDWTNPNSRSSVEMKNRSFRPEMKSTIDTTQYDTSVLGCPVWWDVAPTIVNTFIEQHDLSGKRIFVFVTSGGSSVDGSVNDLRKNYPDLDFVTGKRLRLSDTDVTSWIE